jgi:hypothetical protein
LLWSHLHSHHSIKLNGFKNIKGIKICSHLNVNRMESRFDCLFCLSDGTLCEKVCQWLATGRWFSPGPPVSSTNKVDSHDIAEILLKVALNTIRQTKQTIKPAFHSIYNATFNNISAISWLSTLLVEETGGPGENHRPVASHWQTFSHNVVHLTLIEMRTLNISGDRHW